MEHHDFVNPVEKFGPELLAQRIEHVALHSRERLRIIAATVRENQMAADVRCHDDDGVFEIYRSAMAIGQATVVENLEQDVEDVGMRLLDFVEQNDRVRSSSHRLGELPAFIVPDIAGGAPIRRATVCLS